jgi:hypothetical protein
MKLATITDLEDLREGWDSVAERPTQSSTQSPTQSVPGRDGRSTLGEQQALPFEPKAARVYRGEVKAMGEHDTEPMIIEVLGRGMARIDDQASDLDAAQLAA